MFTDMVGYTAAAQVDEETTLRLRKEQEDLIRPVLVAHQGREVKSTGDGFLVEFESALKATGCAVDIQRRLHERNGRIGVAPIQLRIGLHLGDVEQQGTDIFGDAVNIAARIEPVAEPGGICLSGAVYEQVRNKIPDKLEKLLPTALKGVQIPIELYRIVLPWAVQEASPGPIGPTGLAVLPFKNISPDPKDEYFAEGLTEELISVISQLRGLRVISRTSVMQYRTTAKSISQVGLELGVSSVLEGSVRKAGSRLRITAQLIDARSDRHLWAKSYDRELDDVFAVQTEIARQVADAMEVELRPAEQARLDSRPSVNPESYLAYLKGRALMHEYSKVSHEAAKEQFALAISLDPSNAAAHAGLADIIRYLGGWWGVGGPRTVWDEEGRRLTARAIQLDPNLAEAHASLGLILWDSYDWAGAEKEFKLALSLNPSYSLAHRWYGQLLEDQARVDEALTEFMLAEGSDPLWPDNLGSLAELLLWLGRFDEALVKINKLGEVAPEYWWYRANLAFYHLLRGDVAAGVREFHKFEEVLPNPAFKPIARAFIHAVSGDMKQGRELIDRAVEAPEARRYADRIAWVYAELGDLDACFRWLDAALTDHDLQVLLYRLYPRLAPVRQDPRFKVILKKMHLA